MWNLSLCFTRFINHKKFLPFNHTWSNPFFGSVGFALGAKSKVQKVDVDYDREIEDALNKQIMIELRASYIYLAMAGYFGRSGISLPGFEKFFEEQSNEERTHAVMFINYLNLRGGKVKLVSLPDPSFIDISPLEAFQKTLSMENEVYQSLLKLHRIAGDRSDPNLSDFLETNYLEGQIQDIKKITDFVATLERVGDDGLGLYLFDQQLGGGQIGVVVPGPVI